MSLQLKTITNITKEYPDMIKVVLFKEPHTYIVGDGSRKRRKQDVEEDYTPAVSSLNRTKVLVQDIVLCNDFDLFCTFTFDPNKIDRFNYGKCYLRISTWLRNQTTRARERGKDFKYLIVPEQHKSGAWHFHALLAQYTGTLKRSGHYTSTGRPIYNITSYYGGFTTAVEIDDKQAVSSYITKYITKDFIKKFGQRRFMCSKNLNRPVKITNSPIFHNTLPIFRRKVAESLDSEQFLLFPY